MQGVLSALGPAVPKEVTASSFFRSKMFYSSTELFVID